MTVGSENISSEELYNVVCGAASQDPAQLQTSSKRLKELLDSPGALDILHQIATQRDVPLAVRQQSIIQFRNGINNHWRSRKCVIYRLWYASPWRRFFDRLLSDEQRSQIKLRSLTLLDEPDDMVGIRLVKSTRFKLMWMYSRFQNTMYLSSGRSSDRTLPRTGALQWYWPYYVYWNTVPCRPTLIPHLMSILNSHIESRFVKNDLNTPVLPMRRSLQILNGILKEFMPIRTPIMVGFASQVRKRAPCEYWSRLICDGRWWKKWGIHYAIIMLWLQPHSHPLCFRQLSMILASQKTSCWLT